MKSIPGFPLKFTLAKAGAGMTIGSELIFYRPNGGPYKRWHVFKPFKRVLKVAGIDSKKYSWKELRHTTASLMHRKGVPVLAIKEQSIHTNIKTTYDFYIGRDSDYRREQNEKLTLNSGEKGGK